MGGTIRRRLVFGTCLIFVVTCHYRPIFAGEYGSWQRAAARGQSSAVETANFRIYGISRLQHARTIGDDFEKLRSSLCRTWLGERQLPDWSPKCDVVVHATAASYRRAVGQDQFTTVGASRIDTVGDQITLRRLDIRADQPGWFAAAVPHELTHVIMAEEFRAGQLPAWADEGMALLADTHAKQSLHRRDLVLGRQSGRVCRLVQFVSRTSYPAATEIPVFYGQSASLVAFLVARQSAADFVRFLHLAEAAGCDAALSEVYSLGNTSELEHEWLASTSATSESIMAASASLGATAVHASPHES